MFSFAKLLYTPCRPLSTVLRCSINQPFSTATKGPFYMVASHIQTQTTREQPPKPKTHSPSDAGRNAIQQMPLASACCEPCPVCNRPTPKAKAKKKGPSLIFRLIMLIGRIGLGASVIVLSERLGVWRPMHPTLNSMEVVAKEADQLCRDIQLTLRLGDNGN